MKRLTHGLISACAAMLLAPTSGFAAPEVYGKFMLGLENIDKEKTLAQPDNTDDWEVQSYASRFGIKGSMDTDYESIKIVYMLEWQVDVTDESKSSNDHIKSRNQYAGLATNAGEVIIGRNDTPFKQAQGKVDLFNDIVDMGVIMASGEIRSDNIIQYTSPKIADAVSVQAMFRPGEEDTVDPVTGDAENGLADATSLSVSYDDDMFHFAVAADSDVTAEGVDATRFVGTAKFGSFGVGALLQSTDFAGGVGPANPGLTPAQLAAITDFMDDEKVVLASFYYTLDKTTFKLQTGTASNYGGIKDADADYTVAGVDFALSKKTTLGIYLAKQEGGDGLQTTPAVPATQITPAIPAVSQGKDILGLLMVHSF